MRREARGTSVSALNPEKTLYEVGSKETWQSTLTTMDGREVGPVVRHVIEPLMYTVRYFVVYDLEGDRHVLVPSNTVTDISSARVRSSVTSQQLDMLPSFTRTMTRHFEETLYRTLGRTPHWVEESRARGGQDQDIEDPK